MRALFTAVTAGGMLVAVLVPTVPACVPLALAAALITVGAAFVAWPWVEGRPGVDTLIARGLERDADTQTANRTQVRL